MWDGEMGIVPRPKIMRMANIIIVLSNKPMGMANIFVF